MHFFRKCSIFRQIIPLKVSRLQNAIYFSIITMPKKSHFNIFAIQNFMQNMKTHIRIQFVLLWSCFWGKWMVFSWLFPSWIYSSYWSNSMQCKKFSTCHGVLMALWAIFFAIQNIYVKSNLEQKFFWVVAI